MLLVENYSLDSKFNKKNNGVNNSENWIRVSFLFKNKMLLFFLEVIYSREKAMNKITRTLVLGIALLMAGSAIAADRYLLNAGDILEISVWNEETLQKEVIVLPDGIVTFPLAGEVMARGKTVADVQSALKRQLAKYLTDPVVTVSVVSVDGNTVHVMGKVIDPGNYVMSQPLDVMQALSLAGGLSPYAEENNIIVLRRNGGKQQTLHVHYASIKKGKDLASNIMLISGDVVVIP
jgi:polysaccharide biosynthesis/export protein